MHLIIQANSPGEIAAWVFPIVQTFKKICPESIITLCLVPCQYASRNEKKINPFLRLDNDTIKQYLIKHVPSFIDHIDHPEKIFEALRNLKDHFSQ